MIPLLDFAVNGLLLPFVGTVAILFSIGSAILGIMIILNNAIFLGLALTELAIIALAILTAILLILNNIF